MLVQFSVGNFRSFKGTVTLDLVATKDKILSDENTFEAASGLRLLKSVVLYGANASGKSNLLKALEFMKTFVNESAKESQAGDPINTEPFLLDSKTENAPSFFEILLFLDGVRYRYGFEVTQKEIVSEWLYHMPNKKETYLFTRDKENFELSRSFKEGKGLEERTRKNALFLSVIGQFNGKISKGIINWFSNLENFSGERENSYRGFSTSLLKDSILKNSIVSIIKRLDLGINDVRLKTQKVNKNEVSNLILGKWRNSPALFERVLDESDEIEFTDVYTVHKKYHNAKNPKGTLFKLRDQESDGTQKLFALASAITKSLLLQTPLIIDEIDARFHPLITENLIDFFYRHKGDQKVGNAQLVFATHDVNLLRNDRFRRDQIWFVEKDKYGASHLYSLSDFKVRNDASYQKDYLQGRYGAIPFIGAQNFMEGWTDAKETRKAS